MRKRLLALVITVGWLLSGCGMIVPQPQLKSAPATQSSATTSTAPTTEPTFPTETTATPTTTQPPVTVPPEPIPEEPEEKITICIDAGHQRRGISEKEPNGPGSDVMKAKLTSGTQGVATNNVEYQLNLDVSLLLEQELLARGYEVVMIRRTNDCPLSNAERAQVANDSGADIFIRIHANGSDDPDISGALCCSPTKNNPYLTEEVITESIRLSELVVDSFCAATGTNNQGVLRTDTMTGINWCQIPVTIVEMGYMSNPAEDQLMATDTYREKMVRGIANGIDAFFGL